MAESNFPPASTDPGDYAQAINHITYIPHPRMHYRHSKKPSLSTGKNGNRQVRTSNESNTPVSVPTVTPPYAQPGVVDFGHNPEGVPYVKIHPGTDEFAILNLPLLPRTYKVAFMIEANFAKYFPGARIVFTDTHTMGSLTLDDVRHPHRNLLEGFNETRVIVPKENEGVYPNRVHFFSRDPIMGDLKIYDMKKVFPEDERFFQPHGDEIERTITRFSESTDQFKTMVYETYRGGKDWREELNEWAKAYGAETVVKEACWPTEQPMEENYATELLKAMADNNPQEIQRNQAVYSELLDTQEWVHGRAHSNLVIREKQMQLDMDENVQRFRQFLQQREDILRDKHRWGMRLSVFMLFLQMAFVIFILKAFPVDKVLKD